MRLSLRLNTILQFCEPGIPLWDLCCDHGYLGLHALSSGLASEVVFNDCVDHVIADLRQRLNGAAGARVICSPAEDIAEPLTGNVVLAGIGGERMHKILSAHSLAGRLCARRLILCPEKDAAWLAAQAIPDYEICERREIPHGRGARHIFVYDRRLGFSPIS